VSHLGKVLGGRGRHADVLAELRELVRENPLRERAHWLLMCALYRSGRQAEALAAYPSARAALVGELGIEPGPRFKSSTGGCCVRTPRCCHRNHRARGGLPSLRRPVRWARSSWLR
jgi:DNA-binding SARP family transcriptional activator